MAERWKVCERFPRYLVSSEGRIRRILTGEIKRSFVQRHNPYALTLLFGAKKRMIVRVVTLVADAFLGPRPPGMQIDHINQNPTDDRAANLRYCTQSENIKAAYEAGRTRLHTYVGLTQGDYDQIFIEWEAGQSQCQIGDRYGITNGSVSKVVNGKTKPRFNTKQRLMTARTKKERRETMKQITSEQLEAKRRHQQRRKGGGQAWKFTEAGRAWMREYQRKRNEKKRLNKDM